MIWIFMNKTQEISNIDMKCQWNNDSINRIKPMKFHRTQGLSFGSQGPGQERDLRLVLFVVLHPKTADPEATAGDPSGSKEPVLWLFGYHSELENHHKIIMFNR